MKKDPGSSGRFSEQLLQGQNTICMFVIVKRLSYQNGWKWIF